MAIGMFNLHQGKRKRKTLFTFFSLLLKKRNKRKQGTSIPPRSCFLLKDFQSNQSCIQSHCLSRTAALKPQLAQSLRIAAFAVFLSRYPLGL